MRLPQAGDEKMTSKTDQCRDVSQQRMRIESFHRTKQAASDALTELRRRRIDEARASRRDDGATAGIPPLKSGSSD